LALIATLTLFGESLSGSPYDLQNSEIILLPPGAHHLFGTDSLGRDVFSRVFVGARSSLLIALTSSVLALVLGLVVGTASGWIGGARDRWILRGLDILQAIPSFLTVSLLCLFFQNAFGVLEFETRNVLSLILGIGLVHWFNVAKVSRGLTRKIAQMNYVEAAEALGAGPVRIVWQHVLPNMRETLWVLFTLQIPASIVYESMISFAGYGLQSPQVSWGILLLEGWRTLAQFPHLLLLPALVLFLTVLGFHLVVTKGSH
jgi:oligopeptide transport system permease protein